MNGSYDGLTELQFVEMLFTITGLEKRVISKVLQAQADLMIQELAHRGHREVVIPYLGFKLRMTISKATKARKGRNFWTGEELTVAAKPPAWKVRGKAFAKINRTLAALLPKADLANW